MIAAATGKQADLLAQPVNLHTVEANANSQKQLTIQEILENHLLVGEKDTQAAAIPAMVKNVVGKTCVFDVKINHYNTNLGYEEYTVIKLSESSTVDAHPIPVGSEPTTKRQRVE
ncbi:hypothetical protein ACET3Z_013270 [Daucus carota]